MAEIVSAFPTAGGIYYWASKLGGPVWGWFTGWFNLIGLIGVVASVDYACAQFLSITISLFDPSWDALNLKRVFIIYLCLLTCHTILNIFPSHILAYWNNTSAVWHIVGPAIIVMILIFVPDHHQSVSWVFTERANGSGFFGGETGGAGWLFYVLPFGALLLTQYTITGFDACAHLSEETREASMGAAKGVWKAIFYSAIGGWILLLCFLFAATNVDAINKNPVRLHRDRGVPDLARPDGVQDRDDHLDRGAVLLRRLRDDVGVADDVRLQPRPCHSGLAAVVEGHRVEGPPERDDVHRVLRARSSRSRRSRATPPTRRSRSSR